MARESWGLWGSADEIGALNRLTPAGVVNAASLVRRGIVQSLAQPLSSRTPVPGHRNALQHLMNRDGGDYAAGARRPHGFQFAEDTLILPVHIGTHIDALCHAWYDDELYNGHPSAEISSRFGAKRCGAEKLPPIVARGVLLDVTPPHGGPLPLGHGIGRDELMHAAERCHVTLASGDVVLIRTGWLECQSGAEFGGVDFNSEPGITVDAALWLANAGVVAVGADNFAIEALPFPPNEIFPVHQRLIRDYGIPLLEGLVLAPLAAQGVAEFLFVAAALPIVGGTGSPLTPVAIF